MHTSAHGAWHGLRTWSEIHLPGAASSLGAPVSSEDWASFLTWIGVDATVSTGPTGSTGSTGRLNGGRLPPGLLQLRILSSIHDGQAFATDANASSPQYRGNGLDDAPTGFGAAPPGNPFDWRRAARARLSPGLCYWTSSCSCAF